MEQQVFSAYLETHFPDLKIDFEKIGHDGYVGYSNVDELRKKFLRDIEWLRTSILREERQMENKLSKQSKDILTFEELGNYITGLKLKESNRIYAQKNLKNISTKLLQYGKDMYPILPSLRNEHNYLVWDDIMFYIGNYPQHSVTILSEYNWIPGKILEVVVGSPKVETQVYGFSFIPYLSEKDMGGHLISSDIRSPYIIKREDFYILRTMATHGVSPNFLSLYFENFFEYGFSMKGGMVKEILLDRNSMEISKEQLKSMNQEKFVFDMMEKVLAYDKIYEPQIEKILKKTGVAQS